MLTEDLTKIPDLIDDPKSPWHEFENNFEEGWGGNSNVFCLANQEHHRQVANLAAYRLSKEVRDPENFYFLKNWEELAQKAYNEAAKDLYPNERLWSGDHHEDPDFWYWHEKLSIQSMGSYEYWNNEFREDWGISLDDYEPKVSNYLYDINKLHQEMISKEKQRNQDPDIIAFILL